MVPSKYNIQKRFMVLVITINISLLYALKSPVQTIVFNDLKVDGFQVASRQDGLDWNHCELILQQLGKFHAASMVMAKKVSSILLLLSSNLI